MNLTSNPPPKLLIGLDTLLLLLLTSTQLTQFPNAARPILVALMVAYVVVDVLVHHFHPSERTTFRFKHGLLVALVTAFLVYPTLSAIVIRHFADEPNFAHDGLIQTEEAAKFFLAGINPYATNYLNTPMANWRWHVADVAVNPSLFYFVYQPFSFLSAIPFMWLSDALLGWFDLRFVFILSLYFTLPLFFLFTSDLTRQLLLTIVVLFNPFVYPFFVEGRSDFYILFWIWLAVALALRSRWTLSAIALGLACAIKPYAWFFAPFYLLWAWPGGSLTDRSAQWLWLRRIWLVAATFAIVVLPFVLWNPGAYWDATVRYPAGQTPHIYPITGYGFSPLTLLFGWIHQSTDYFPFWIPQLLFGLPVMLLILKAQWRSNTTQLMWAGTAALMFCLTYFTRHFDDGQIGVIVSFITLAVFSDPLASNRNSLAMQKDDRTAREPVVQSGAQI